MRRNFQLMMNERLQKELAEKAAAQGGFVRPVRAAASECLKSLRDEHDRFKLARAERNAKKNADNLESSSNIEYMPQKDKSIQMQKIYEF